MCKTGLWVKSGGSSGLEGAKEGSYLGVGVEWCQARSQDIGQCHHGQW